MRGSANFGRTKGQLVFILLAASLCLSCGLSTNGRGMGATPPTGAGGEKIAAKKETLVPQIKNKVFDPIQMLSKILGLGIMSGSLFLKVPQIVKILSTQSVEGLSPMAIYHELPLYSSGVMYHWLHKFPLSTYGDSVVILLQNVIVIFLMWIYRKPPTHIQEILSQTAQFVALSIVQFNLPKSLQPILIYINIPLLLSSCIPQIVINARQRHTGALAISTCAMKSLGSSMRLYTTLAEIGADKGLLASYGLSAVLNGWMMVQGWMYQDETRRVMGEGKNSKAN